MMERGGSIIVLFPFSREGASRPHTLAGVFRLLLGSAPSREPAARRRVTPDAADSIILQGLPRHADRGAAFPGPHPRPLLHIRRSNLYDEARVAEKSHDYMSVSVENEAGEA